MNSYKYKDIVSLPIFFEKEWMEIVCVKGKWEILTAHTDSGSSVMFPIYKTKKYGFNIISNPPLTPYQGILIYKSDKDNEADIEKAVNIVINNVPSVSLFQQSFLPSFNALTTVLTKAYKNTTKFTYIIDTKQDIKKLRSNLDAKTRNIISKAEKTLRCKEEFSTINFNALNKMTFERKGLKLPYDFSIVNALFDKYNKAGKIKIMTVTDESNNVHASILLAIDNAYIYCLAIGSDSKFRASGAVSLAIWKSIEMAQSMGLDFDFEGSMISSIESFFRSFGGFQQPYLQLSKIRNSILELVLHYLFNVKTN